MWLRKDKFLIIQLVTILFLFSNEPVISTEYDITIDQYVYVFKSVCVIVPCKFMADSRHKFLNAKGLWIQKESIVASSEMSEGTKQNFHAIGNPNDGDCTLKIENIRKEDAGEYMFRFEERKNSKIKYTYTKKPLKLFVTDFKEVDGFSIQLNQTVIVQKGLCVTIPCTFTADYKKSFSNSQGHWRTPCHEFVTSNNKSIVGIKQNFRLMGNPDNGDCTLMITDANEQDSGIYYFRFEDVENKRYFSFLHKMITVKATDLNEKPVISDPGILTEGKKVTLTCKAPRGCPNTLITWQNQTEIWSNATDLTFVPNRSHHQTSLICQMSFSSSKNFTQHQTTLYVEYPPSIIIIIKTSELTNMTNEEELTNMTNQEVTVQEGSSLILNCSVDSNPGAQVTWVKGEKNVLSKGTQRELMLYLNNITASGADKYLCLAQNDMGAINQTISIIVKYPTPINMIAWITVIVSIALILIGLGTFCFVRYRKKNESGYENAGFKSELKRRKAPDPVDDEPEKIYANVIMKDTQVDDEPENIYANM